MPNNIIEEKSFAFALDIIRLYQERQQERAFVLSKQLLRAGTSIGAQVEEAHAGQSRRDFLSKMSIASKEARETHYWLRLLKHSRIGHRDYTPYLMKVDEIRRILAAIVKTTSESLNERPGKHT